MTDASGAERSTLTLIEYSDFTCGYCLKFFKETLPRLQATYIDTGKVKFVYRDYPRADHGVGVEAAVAARCAGAQGRYWAMHDRLFGEGSRLDSGAFKGFAKSIGLDQTQFGKCFDERRHLESIFQDRQEANRWGFHGTPGFILMQTAAGPTEKVPAIAITGDVGAPVVPEVPQEQPRHGVTARAGGRRPGGTALPIRSARSRLWVTTMRIVR